ncbi:NADPH-dependent 7-cyano-7-deazaguanine reductase [Striga asiatica]|uniref:NADPH-dependent 7-cyano-7-deazaguanine reductase n=1 Tax=Striga asiatica TaxID=4170 RepID=A0A5A7NZD6_STRAF|nr:NADPH-dependent 7-cyano-7-deazaguanine reductase [Striga asiatica]
MPPVGHVWRVLVLVRERVHVNVDVLAWPLGCPSAAGDEREEGLVEPLGVGCAGVRVPVSGPPDLGDDDLHVVGPDLLEGPHEGVVHELERVGVHCAPDVGHDVG